MTGLTTVLRPHRVASVDSEAGEAPRLVAGELFPVQTAHLSAVAGVLLLGQFAIPGGGADARVTLVGRFFEAVIRTAALQCLAARRAGGLLWGSKPHWVRPLHLRTANRSFNGYAGGQEAGTQGCTLPTHDSARRWVPSTPDA